MIPHHLMFVEISWRTVCQKWIFPCTQLLFTHLLPLKLQFKKWVKVKMMWVMMYTMMAEMYTEGMLLALAGREPRYNVPNLFCTIYNRLHVTLESQFSLISQWFKAHTVIVSVCLACWHCANKGLRVVVVWVSGFFLCVCVYVCVCRELLMDHAGTDSLSVVPLDCLLSSGLCVHACWCTCMCTLAHHIVYVHPSPSTISLVLWLPQTTTSFVPCWLTPWQCCL